MFTLFSLRRSEPLSDEEIVYLRKMLSAYADTDAGGWLREIPWTRITFRWSPAMEGSDVNGCFSVAAPSTVFLRPNPFDGIIKPFTPGRVVWFEDLFFAVIHELRHALQFRRNPLLYVLCALPGLRQLTLERDAGAVEKDAERFAQGWAISHARAEFFSRYGKSPDEVK